MLSTSYEVCPISRSSRAVNCVSVDLAIGGTVLPLANFLLTGFSDSVSVCFCSTELSKYCNRMDLPSREFSRLQIKPLDSSANWLTWRYRVEILLRHYPGALDIVEGRTSVPVSPTDATDAQRKQFEDSLVKFRSAETSAMILLTANMSDSLTERLITIKEPRVLWLELHRLFGGVQETKAYDLCTKFFRFQPRDGDDMAAQLSEVKAIWSSLKAELAVSDSTVSLPEMFLICKILDMLPEKYDTFKQNWAMFPQAS